MRTAFVALAILGTIVGLSLPASARYDSALIEADAAQLKVVCASEIVKLDGVAAITTKAVSFKSRDTDASDKVAIAKLPATGACFAPPNDSCLGTWTYDPHNRTDPNDDEFDCTGVHSQGGAIDCVGIYWRNSDGSEGCTGV